MDVPALSSRHRTITCVGFDWRAEVSFKQTLALLHDKTIDDWQYCDELIADVVVYDSGNALAQAMVRRNGGASPGRIFFPSSSQDKDELSLGYPFGASRLIRCLNHASQRLAGAGSSGAAAISLCQCIDDASRTPGVAAVSITMEHLSGVLHLGEQRLYWPQPMDLDQTAKLLSSEVRVQPLGGADEHVLHSLRGPKWNTSPAEGLLWAIGIGRSSGALLHRLDGFRCYRLKRWPDFGAIGRRGSDLRCASLLMQRALSQSSLAAMTAIPAGVIGGFLNAAALCGLLEEAESTEPAQPARVAAASQSSRMGGMLRRIRQALALDS